MNPMNNPNHPAQDPVTKAVQDNGNSKLVGAKELLKEKLLAAVLQQAINELGEPATIARSIMSAKGTDLGSILVASRVLKELIVAEIENRSKQNFADPNAVATDLFEGATDQGKLVDDVAAELRSLILASASRNAEASVADKHAVANEMLGSGLVDSSIIDQIKDSLRAQMLERAAESSANSLSDVDSAASEVIRGMGENPATISELSDRVRQLILTDVERRAHESIADKDATSDEVWQRIAADTTAINAVVDRVHETLIGDIANRSRRSLEDVEASVSSARSIIGEDADVVTNVATKLEEILIREVVQSGERALADTQSAVKKALEEIKPSESDLTRIQERLKSKILSDVLNRAIKEINDEVSATAAEIWLADGQSDELLEGGRVDRPSQPTLGESIPAVQIESLIESGDEITQSESDETIDMSELIAASDQNEDIVDQIGSSEANVENDVESNSQFTAESTDNTDEESEVSTVGSDELPAMQHRSIDEEWYEVIASESSAAMNDEPAGDDSSSSDSVSWAETANDLVSEGDEVETTDTPVSETNESEESTKAPEGILAGWRRRRKSWKVDEVDFSTDAESVDESTNVSSGDTTTMDEVHANDSDSDSWSGESEVDPSKESWTVAIIKDRMRLSSKVRESDQMIEDSLEQISKGVVTFVKEEMHRLDGLGSSEAAELMCEHCIQRTHTALSDRTLESRRRDISMLTNGDVIFVASYLVEKGNGQVVQDEVSRLSAEFEDLGFTLMLDGPHSSAVFSKDDPSSKVEDTVA